MPAQSSLNAGLAQFKLHPNTCFHFGHYRQPPPRDHPGTDSRLLLCIFLGIQGAGSSGAGVIISQFPW